MGEHRVSMLSASLRRYEDPARSADPRIRELVARLATLDEAPAPRAHFRAELRAQLVAVAPRLIAEGPTVEAPSPAKASSAAPAPVPAGGRLRGALGRFGHISIGRPLGIVTAVIAVFAVLLGGAVWISKKALPGDALYGLKRANENVQLSFATDDTAKGRDYLTFARSRAEEVATLLSRSSALAVGYGPGAAGGVNAHTAHLITSTLDAADSELRNGAQLLGGAAVRNSSAAPLSIMSDWAPGQVTRLQSITDRLGTGALHDRAAASRDLAAAAATRARALSTVVGCACLSSARTDDLGPVPCTNCGVAQDPTQQSSTTPAGSSPSVRGTPSGTRTTGRGPAGPGSVGVPTLPGSGSGSTGIRLPTLPTLPTPTLPTLPIPTTGARTTPGGASATQTCTLSLLGICIHI